MPQFSREFLEDLQVRVDAVQLIGERVALERAGKSFKGRCPFHQEKTPSFHVYPDSGTYHCFGCGAHGSSINFVQETQNKTFPEAVQQLAAMAGMKLPNIGTSRMSDARLKRLNTLYSALDQAKQFFVEALRSSKSTQQYLTNRGLLDETIERYGIGFAPDSFGALKSALSHIKEDVLLDCGLLVKKDDKEPYDRFRNRVMFPIRDTRGRVMGFGGRVLGPDAIPKYINSPASEVYKKGRELYGLYEARNSGHKLTKLLVTEGYMDVVTLAQHGIPYAVAPLGTALTDDQFLVLRRYTNEIVCCFDGDDAGKQAAWRALLIGLSCLKANLKIRIAILPDKHDPDSFVREHGSDEFQNMIESAEPAADYFFRELAKGVDLTSVEARVQIVEKAMGPIRSIPYTTYRQVMIARLAETTRMPVQDIEDIGRFATPHPGDRINRRQSKKPTTDQVSMSPGERNVLKLLVHDFGFVNRIPDNQLASIRKWKKSSFLLEVLCRIRDDKLRNFSELLGSYSGSHKQEVLSGLASLQGPEISGNAIGSGIFDALDAILLRLEREDRRKRVPRESSQEAGKVYRDIVEEQNTSEKSHTSTKLD
ncbi:MAG: DNA primase [Gammaproteobacteria bacterium]|nr:DNA primase [Gammaproteobacteria bacterium]